MSAELQQRCKELIARGDSLSKRIRIYENRPNYWHHHTDIPELRAWIASTANFFRLIATPDTFFHQECIRAVEDKALTDSVPTHTTLKLLGLLRSVSEEIEAGLMRKAEYVFIATTFDSFLDHAAEYHKSEKKIESSVLASTVFEDTLRKIAQKYEVTEASRSIESIIDDLAKKGVLTSVKAKRVKGFGSVRNKALHAQWDDFDIRDVGELISGTRELLEML